MGEKGRNYRTKMHMRGGDREKQRERNKEIYKKWKYREMKYMRERVTENKRKSYTVKRKMASMTEKGKGVCMVKREKTQSREKVDDFSDRK